MQHLEAGRERGAHHVVVDPRATATARTAHVHLQPRPGTDAALANGLLHLVVRRGWVDEEYVAARTVEFEAVRESVTGYWPDRVERITGVPAADLEAVAELLGTASTAMVITARGAEQHASGTATAQAFINLALALGLPGRPGSGYGTLTGQGNGQGGREHGQKADQLPGYRKITDLAHRAHVAGVWGVDPTRLPGPGVSATEMLRALGTPGGVRTLLLLASNVTVSAPDAGSVTDRVDALDFLDGRRPVPLRVGRPRGRRAARGDVGRGGGHDDEPGGPGAAPSPRARPAAGRADRPRRPGGRRRPAGARAPHDDRRGGRVRRARPGERGRRRRLRRHHLRPHRGRAGRVLAVHRRRRPGHAAAVRRPVRAPRRARPVHPGRVPRAGGAHRPGVPVRPDHRAADAAVPERHADPAGRGARRRRGGARRDRPAARRAAPRPGPPLRRRRRRARAAAHAPGRRGVPGTAHHRHPDRHRVRPVPLVGRVPREHPHARRPRPGLPHARVQGVRRGRRPSARTQHATGRHHHGAHPCAVAPGPTEGTCLGQSPDLPAGRLRADRQGPGRPGAARPEPELHGARRRGGADGVLPRRQQHRRARRRRAGARRGAHAVLPHRRQGRRARPAARRRGPGARHDPRGARGRRGGRLGRRSIIDLGLVEV